MFQRSKDRKLSLVVAGIIIYSITITMFTFSSVTVTHSVNYPTINRLSVENTDQDHYTISTDSDMYVLRIRRANKVCFKSKVKENVCVFSDKLNKLELCPVAKVGSTFWINVLRFINNETGDHQYSSPFKIPRIITHGGAIFTNVKCMNRDEPDTNHTGKSLRFMFVREPYSRLWSAWIDKFLLPGLWFFDGVNIAKYLNSSKDIEECPKDISFVQFLTYITSDEVMQTPELMNNHWKPYHYICDPCFFRPDVIGKIETFSTDTRAILEAVNYTWVLNNSKSDSSSDRSLLEMRMLTTYNFQWTDMLREAHSSCINDTDIFKRLWIAFQLNGHLPINVPFPYPITSDTPITIKEFMNQFESTYIEWQNEQDLNSERNKSQAMAEAYREVPIEIIHKLQKLYALDFEMFGYDSFPAELFQATE